MSVVTRGVKNAFRNWLRTLAVVLILAIGIGLSLSMLVANQAVGAKIADLKTKMGNTITINPAGAEGFQGGGEPFKSADADTVSKVPHVSSVDTAMTFRVRNSSADDGRHIMFGNPNGSSQAGNTSLNSAIDAGTLGKRFTVSSPDGEDTNQAPPQLPITGVGVTGNYDQNGNVLNITSGRAISSSDTDNVAVIGKGLADKNNLKVGDTFTAYDTTFTVVGIFDAGTEFQNGSFEIPLSVAQRVTNQPDEIDSMVARIDSADNLNSTKDAIKSALGSKADVNPGQQNVQTAIDSLQSVQQISMIAFIGALVAAAVITFLIMLMIVRERKKEIGVLKAIGGSNTTIVSQFIVESLVLVVLGTIVGFGVSSISSNGIANALVSNSTNTPASDQPDTTPKNGGFRGPGLIKVDAGKNALQNSSALVGQVVTSVGWMTLVYGLLAALGIAVVGSAIPAWLISKVRPAEVMRGE